MEEDVAETWVESFELRAGVAPNTIGHLYHPVLANHHVLGLDVAVASGLRP
jgi:hypothetical protein